MQVTNLSQIHVAVRTEVVPRFFMDVIHQAAPGELKVGDRCFIYDDDFKPTTAHCSGIADEYFELENANGVMHKVPNQEPPLNNHEFNRLLGAKFTSSEKRSGYDQHVINRALSANVIHTSTTEEHEFTDYGNELAKAHFKV